VLTYVSGGVYFFSGMAGIISELKEPSGKMRTLPQGIVVYSGNV